MTTTKLKFRPYLFRAYLHWMLANGLKPHVAILWDKEKMDPFLEPYAVGTMEGVVTSIITFNIRPDVIPNLYVDDRGLSFSAEFNGVPKDIFIPLDNIFCLFDPPSGAKFFLPRELEPYIDRPEVHKKRNRRNDQP